MITKIDRFIGAESFPGTLPVSPSISRSIAVAPVDSPADIAIFGARSPCTIAA